MPHSSGNRAMTVVWQQTIRALVNGAAKLVLPSNPAAIVGVKGNNLGVRCMGTKGPASKKRLRTDPWV